VPLRERFPFLERTVPEWAYHTLIAILSEFLGTTFFLFFALAGTQVAYTHLSPSTVILPGSPARPGGGAISSASLLYAALSVGFSMMVNAWIFFRISSGLFNPAITFGMVVEGSLGWKKGGYIVVAQFAGGMAAAGLVSGLFPGHLRAETLLGSGASVVRGLCEYCSERLKGMWILLTLRLVIELLLTAAFVFSVFMLATEKHKVCPLPSSNNPPM
jgi:aquaporin related protein